jgi:hypothetical protein
MKAGHILFLLIALIAVSHVRRDMLTGKKEFSFMKAYSSQAVPESNELAGSSLPASYMADIRGAQRNNKNTSLYYFKSKQ